MNFNWVNDILNYNFGQHNMLDGFIIGGIAALVGAVIELIVANMTLKDSLDSKSRWREQLFNVASKDKIELKDVYTLRTALRFEIKEKTTPIHGVIINKIITSIIKLLILLIVIQGVVKINLPAPVLILITIGIYLVIKSLAILILTHCNCDFFKIYTKNYFYMENIDSKDYNFDSMTHTIIVYCNLIFEGNLKLDNSLVQENIRIICRYMLKHQWEYLSVPDYRIFKKIQITLDDRKTIEDTVKTLKINNYLYED